MQKPISVALLILWLFPLLNHATERHFFTFQNGLRFGTTEERIDFLRQEGYHGIGSASPVDLERRLKLYREAGLAIYSLYLGGKPGPVSEKIKVAIQQLKGSGTMIELYVQRGKSSGDNDAVAFVQEVADLAKESRIQVVLYPHEGFHVAKLSDAVRIAKAANRDNVGVMFNLCHFLKVEPDQDIKTELERAGDLLWRVSLSDTDIGGTSWAELIQPLDSGTFDQANLLQILDEVGFEGDVGLQCYAIKGDPKENLRKSIAAWRKLHGEEPASEQIQKIVAEYQTKWKKHNEEELHVDPILFGLCQMPTRAEMKHWQQQISGPHFRTKVNIYLNPEAEKVVSATDQPFSTGSVIVKEKKKSYAGAGKDGVGGMIKREAGYDPKNGNWEYFYKDNTGRIAAGRMKNCIECHSKAKQTDYVFGKWADPKRQSLYPGY